jgi:indole-3-glycerol phosphate synthase
VLYEIVAARRKQLQTEHRKNWQRRAKRASGSDLLAALSAPGTRLIAEVKPASPSRGRILDRKEIPRLVRAYERGGAAAISVLAEPAYFQGGGELVSLVRSLTSLPILWKDFVISPSQIYEAKARGAAGVLLIARILTARELAAFIRLANKLGLLPLVEVHREEELGKLAEISERFALGINNRNLSSLKVDLAATFNLLPTAQKLQPACLVSESGIKTRDDIQRLEALGCTAFLVGESLLFAQDPEKMLRELRGEARVD